MHERVLGSDKLPRDFSPEELERVLEAFCAMEAEGGDRESLIAQCDDACVALWQFGDPRLARDTWRHEYIRGVARNEIGREIAECDEAELAQVLRCLERRMKRKRMAREGEGMNRGDTEARRSLVGEIAA